MVYGYVYKSKNVKAIERQKQMLENSEQHIDKIVMEESKNETLHKLIESLSKGDKLVVAHRVWLDFMKKSDLIPLQENKIEIITLDGYQSAYFNDEESKGKYIELIPTAIYKSLKHSMNQYKS